MEVIKKVILMLYEIRYVLYYDSLKDILLMNCFEYLLWVIYRIDKKYDDPELKPNDSYWYILEKFWYNKYIDNVLKGAIKPKKLSKFKKEQKIPKNNLSIFIEQFQDMRNRIAHGKQHKKPKFIWSPSDKEFTFFYRLECFIVIILVDLIYWKDYKRKFDVLYQLILEKNVTIVLTPEFPSLKFSGIKKKQ